MSEFPRRPGTYADLFDLPEHKVGEIINGDLVVSPRPASPHARANAALTGKLMGPFDQGKDGPGGWWILAEPEIHFEPEKILVPDMAGGRKERLPVFPNAPYFELAPDWICEVLSPSTARIDRAEKLPIYAEYHVAHAWLIDPILRTLEVLRLEKKLWTVVGVFSDSATVRAEPFDAIEIDLSSLWIPAAPAAT